MLVVLWLGTSDGHFSTTSSSARFTPAIRGWLHSVTFGRIQALIVRGYSTIISGGSRTRCFAVVPAWCCAEWSTDYVRSACPRSRCVTARATDPRKTL